MHVIRRSKTEKPRDYIPTVSHWAVPGSRRMRGRRYNSQGIDIGACGPRKPIPDTLESARVKKAITEGPKQARPEEAKPFDLATFTPLPGKLLLRRPPQITEIDGVKLPPNKYQSEAWFYVVKVGPGVTQCAEGDKVVFTRTHKPIPVRLGRGNALHIGRAAALVGILESI